MLSSQLLTNILSILVAQPVISLAAHWQLASAITMPPLLQAWLLEPASLTARLKRRADDFQLQVIQQHLQGLPEFLRPLLPGVVQAECREVLMSCKQLPCVYAQSWIPQSTIAAWQPLAALGEQPLGEVIFQHSKVERSAVEVARLQVRHMPVAAVANGEYWARRSVFTLAGHPLLVAEVFLDGVLAL